MEVVKYKSLLWLTSKLLPDDMLVEVVKCYYAIVSSITPDMLKKELIDMGFGKMNKLGYISSHVSRFLIMHDKQTTLFNLTGMERRSVYLLGNKYGFTAEKVIAGEVKRCRRCKRYQYDDDYSYSQCIDCLGRGTTRNAAVTNMHLIKKLYM